MCSVCDAKSRFFPAGVRAPEYGARERAGARGRRVPAIMLLAIARVKRHLIEFRRGGIQHELSGNGATAALRGRDAGRRLPFDRAIRASLSV